MSLVPHNPVRRFLKYNLVGALGVTVRLAVMALLLEWGGLGYLTATALAVEAAMLHNFGWHLHWTWRERCFGITWKSVLRKLMRFQLSNAAVALIVSLLAMRVLVGELGMHYLPANVIATAAGGIINFLVADSIIFQAVTSSSLRARS